MLTAPCLQFCVLGAYAGLTGLQADFFDINALPDNPVTPNSPETLTLNMSFFVAIFSMFASCSPIGISLFALERDPYFQKNGGRDHVFGYSSWNPGVAKGIGLHRVSKLLKQGHFGVFEVNNAWIGANSQEAGRLDLRDRMIPMPYVVNAATFRGDHREVHTHEISVFFAGS